MESLKYHSSVMAIVKIDPGPAQALAKLPRPINTRVQKIIARLHDWPTVSGAKPLRGNLAGHYRIRTGDYRVQFHLEGDEVVVEKIGHRDGFYEG